MTTTTTTTTNNSNSKSSAQQQHKCRVPVHQCRSDRHRQQRGQWQRWQRHQRYQSKGKASITKKNNNNANVGAIKTWTTAQRNNKDIKLLKSNRRVDVGGDRQAANTYHLHMYIYVCTSTIWQTQQKRESRESCCDVAIWNKTYKKKNKIQINKIAK